MTELATRQLEAFLKNENPEFPFYIGVRHIERSYGGPEEGGWYYDSYVEYENVRWIPDRAEFEKYVREVFESYGLRWTGSIPNSIPSRWDNGDDYRLAYRWGSNFPAPKRRPRPQYE